jgi:hypothetical protein
MLLKDEISIHRNKFHCSRQELEELSCPVIKDKWEMVLCSMLVQILNQE